MVLSNALLMSIEKIGSVSVATEANGYSYSRPQPFSGEKLCPRVMNVTMPLTA